MAKTKYVFREYEAGFFDRPQYTDSDYYEIGFRGETLRCRKMFMYRGVVLWFELDSGYRCVVFKSAGYAAKVFGDLECLSVVCKRIELDSMVEGELVEGNDRIGYCRGLRENGIGMERSEQDSFSWNVR